jgi:hypothetical protein
MSSKKVMVPLTGTNVKKGVNYVKGPDGRPLAVPDEGPVPGPGRPPKHDVAVVVKKSIAIIETINANAREMYMVAVAYFDDQFVAHKEGERVRLQNVCRDIGLEKRNSKQQQYAGLLKRCKIKYRSLVDVARQTPEGRLVRLAYLLSKE